MLTFAKPSSLLFHPVRRRAFACVCPCCLKTWAVCGDSQETRFYIEGDLCLGCANEADSWAWWRTTGSVLDLLESWCGDLKRVKDPIPDILSTLPLHIVRHELICHLNAYERDQGDSID